MGKFASAGDYEKQPVGKEEDDPAQLPSTSGHRAEDRYGERFREKVDVAQESDRDRTQKAAERAAQQKRARTQKAAERAAQQIEPDSDIMAVYRHATDKSPDLEKIQEILVTTVQRVVKQTLDQWEAAENWLRPEPVDQQRRLRYDLEGDQRAPRLIKESLARVSQPPSDFGEWFRMAYALGVVTGCSAAHEAIFITHNGRLYPWEKAAARLPLTRLREIFLHAQGQTQARHILRQHDEAVTKAQPIVKHPSVRDMLCPAFKSVTADLHEIAKVAIPILIPLAIAGTIIVPLTPIIVAGCATVIGRMTVAAFCSDKK